MELFWSVCIDLITSKMRIWEILADLLEESFCYPSNGWSELVVILLSVYQTSGIYFFLIKIMLFSPCWSYALYTTCFMESLLNDALFIFFSITLSWCNCISLPDSSCKQWSGNIEWRPEGNLQVVFWTLCLSVCSVT